jgi:hypothetical protein
MKKYFFYTLFFLINVSFLKSQEIIAPIPAPKAVKGTFYFAWGYNRDWYSKSDIHFKNTSTDYNPVTKAPDDSYDFTVYDVAAKDRPGFQTILTTGLTIPQYVSRIGYYFNKKHDLGVEINFDHAKYVMEYNQTLHVKGTIHGQYIDQDTLISPYTFLHFEHTNGANFLMFNIIKRQQLFLSANQKHKVSGVVKLGGGMVIPKTDVTLFGQRVDNRFHIAGYIVGLEAGFRYEVFKYVFLEYTGKGAFCNYTRVLVNGTEKAKHHFWVFENILTVGVQVPL